MTFRVSISINFALYGYSLTLIPAAVVLEPAAVVKESGAVA